MFTLKLVTLVMSLESYQKYNSPDLSPLDFCLWGYLKSKVYSPRPANLNELQANITREVAQIDPAMVRRAMLDMKARAVKCIAANGGHFEK